MNLTEAGKRIHEAATKNLTALDLSGCRGLTADTLRQLQIQKLGQNIKILDVTKCNLGSNVVLAIIELLPNLTRLYIRNNKIGDAGAMAVAQNLRMLTHLDIGYNNIGGDCAIVIAKNLTNLVQLGISGNSIGDEGAVAIAQHQSKLTQLYIGSNNIGEVGIKAIAQNLTNLNQLYVHNNEIGDDGARVIAQNLPKITQLVISFNSIGKEGAKAIAQHLPDLTQLVISGNNIGEEGAIVIAENLRKLTALDVGPSNIGDIGATAIAQYLHNLVQLDVSDNVIGDDGAIAIAQKLFRLTHLSINYNNVGDEGVKVIAKNLQNLVKLEISDNNISEAGAIAIAQNLKNLSELKIDYNKLGEAGATAIAQNRRNLVQLDISFNEIGNLGVYAIAQKLRNLTSLSISGNNIDSVGTIAIARNLKKLEQLDISYNNIGEVGAETIALNLQNLTQLRMTGNNIGDEGARSISLHLPNLTLLYISDNNIGNLGAMAVAQKLRKLTDLHINNNNIGDIGLKALALSTRLKYTFIYLANNQPKSIPKENANDILALRAYFKAAQKVELIKGNVLRIVLCGNTRAGKTSLATKLMDINLPNPDEDDRTHGIRHWSLQKTVNNNDYYLNIWDFGGQDYYHATHAAILSATDKERDNQLSLYLLVWRYSKPDIRQGCEEEAFQQFGEDYWLGFIHLLAGSPSITLVQTHTDADTPAFPHSRLMRQGAFELSPSSFRYLCLDDKHILSKDGQAQWKVFYDQLIASAIQKIEDSSEKIPATWQQLRQSIIPGIAVQYSVIHRDDLEKLLLAAPLLDVYNDIPAALGYVGLLSYLKGCGDILCWNDPQHPLYETVVLDIERFHSDIYMKLLTDKVRKAGGVLQSTSGYEFHIRYLLHHGLIFEKQESPGIYVAPQYLPVQPLIAHFKQLIPLTIILRFPHYMPRYLITRCIVQVYRQSPKKTDYWKYGCISSWQQGDIYTNFMVAINPDTKEHDVLFYIKDTSSKFELLRRLYSFFASFGTKDIWPVATERKRQEEGDLRMSVSEKEMADQQYNQIPEDITDALQLSTDGACFVEVKEIKKAIKDKQYSVKTTDNRYTKLNTTMQQLVDPNAKPPKKIFFSYSRYEREYLEEFKVHFATLRRQGLIETWFDGELDAGEDANAGIMKELVNADIIICLLSPRFMANDYIWHIEMEKAKELKKTIVPITIKRCDYKGYFADFFGEDKQGFLTQKQFDVENVSGKTLKHDVIWIGSETHEAKRDEYYAFIIDELKKIILK